MKRDSEIMYSAQDGNAQDSPQAPLGKRLFVISQLSLARLRQDPIFECPCCDYSGHFLPVFARGRSSRRYARCPSCHSLERHRLQRYVMQSIVERKGNFDRVLQIAPDPMTSYLRATSNTLVTADIDPKRADIQMDICNIQRGVGTFDLVYASHVLEHISNLSGALDGIRSLVKPGGIAVIPVPILGPTTVEYSTPNRFEHGHVRAPGLDIIDTYRKWFWHVDLQSSDSVPSKYQTHIYEDWTIYPTKRSPSRESVDGERHVDYVPICIGGS
jgi:SAM-dependent methyltransferase